MDKKKLEELLDSIYELEGLVHLAIAREDAPSVLPELIIRKSRELSSRVTEIEQKEEAILISEEVQPIGEYPVEKEVISPVKEEVSVGKEPDMEKSVKIAEPGGRLVFSINDRYRFRRELFENSDADFNTTLALVASMESYEEAEDYFTVEREWDPSVAAVSDFLEVIRKYFG